MKLAFSTLGCPEWDLPGIVEAARAYGYSGVEIRGLQGELDLARVPAFSSDIASTAALFASRGLAVACVSCSAKFSSNDREQWKENIRLAESHIQIARSLKAPCVRVFGGTISEGTDRKRCEDAVVEALHGLGAAGAKAGVLVALETHDSFKTGEQVSALLKRVDHPMVGALWDICHPFTEGEDPDATLRFLAGKVFHVHIKDWDGSTYTLLGKGKVPVLKILRTLNESGYEGFLSVEWEKVWKPELPPPEVAFPQYALRMKEYLQQIGAS